MASSSTISSDPRECETTPLSQQMRVVWNGYGLFGSKAKISRAEIFVSFAKWMERFSGSLSVKLTWLRMRKMLTPDSVRASASLEAVASEPVYSSPDSCLVILLIELLETVKFTLLNRAGGRVGRD